MVLISVIIPVYNVEKYLKQCIDSVLNQTYRTIEIILVDDGSTDSSGKICDAYKNNNENIKVIHKNNEGLGFARNTGLKYVTGKYVIFIDSDDYIDSDFISNLYKQLKETNSDMCKSGFVRVLNSSEIVSKTNYQNEVYKDEEIKEKFSIRFLGSSPEKRDSIEMSACATLYKSDIIKLNNIQFPSERELISEDLVFNIDYLQHTHTVCLSSRIGYFYRVNDKSLTTSYREDRFDACKFFYNEMINKLKKYNYDKSAYLRLQRLFFVYLLMCIKQEKVEIAKHSKKISRRNIKIIMDDICVNEIIENYPKESLGFKQRLFIRLIKEKRVLLLQLLLENGVV